MTREETIRVLMVAQAAYPNWKIPDKTVLVNLWHSMFKTVDYSVVMAAVETHIVSSKFPPGISDVVGNIRMINSSEPMNGGEAWALVSKALRNSTYNSKAEFDKLPAEIQKAVGSPNMLQQWATDEHFNESVVSSNFMRAYDTVVERSNKSAMLPDSVKTLLTAREGSKMIGG